MSSLKEAFRDAEPALRERHGEVVLLHPKRYQPRGGEAVWIAELDLGGRGRVVFPGEVEMLVLELGGQTARIATGPLLPVLGAAAQRLDDPIPHVVVTLSEVDVPRVVSHVAASSGPRPGNGPPLVSDDETDKLIKSAEPSGVVKAAAGAQALAGVFIALTGLQITGTRWRTELVEVVPYALMLLGAFAVFMASSQYRARSWAGLGSAVYDLFLGLLMVAWTLYVFTTIASLMMYAADAAIVLSAILSLLAIGPLNKASEARRKLAAQGMSLGL